MHLCSHCQNKKNAHMIVESEDVFEICRKCGNAYYFQDFENTGLMAGLFERFRLLFH